MGWFWYLYKDLLHYTSHFRVHDWIMLSLLVLMLGLLCMRGFGSRAKF